jgi:hypothetical protein
MKCNIGSVVHYLIGALAIAGILFAIERDSKLPKYVLVLVLAYAVVAILVPAARNHTFTSQLRGVLVAADVWSTALLAASSFMSVHIVLSRYECLGLVNYAVTHSRDSHGKHALDAKSLEISFHWPAPPTRNQFTWGTIGLGAWTQFAFPTWLLPSILTPLAVLLWALRPRPKPNGSCQRCRYDLTGNTSGVCPECGTAISKPLA